MEINDFSTLQDVSSSLIEEAPAKWLELESTILRLQQDPAYVLGLTIQLSTDPVHQPLHNLPFPDFDETGFHGRKNELKRIKSALKSAWPVVSVLGDGGIGKTSVALKVAYEILDDKTFDFDAIVWVTAKATTLTSTEIIGISDAIQDSLGLFSEAAAQLGSPSTGGQNPMNEVLDYLENFKILLVLDNLETVADRRLREFLQALPVGSKVLITSRIGLGMESPVKMSPLSNEESRRLLKALASIRRVEAISGLDEARLERYVHQLKGHPLYIKWLVSGVESGKRPEDLFADNSLLLDFCMSNVYDKLSAEARQIISTLQIVKGQRSQAELAFLSGMSADEIQSRLLELLTTNFVSIKSSSLDDLESLYQVAEFAHQYLSKHQPIDQTYRSQVTRRLSELASIGKRLASDQSANRYDPSHVSSRGPHDIPVAKHLVEALKKSSAGSLDNALESCREAQMLSPTYPEAWRIEARIHVQRQDIESANSAYERAFSLDSDSSLMQYHYGQFLVEQMIDPTLGLNYLRSAARLDTVNPTVYEGLANAYFVTGDYSGCLNTCLGLMSPPDNRLKTREIVHQAVRSMTFGVENFLYEGQLGNALEMIEGFLEVAPTVDPSLLPSEWCDWMIRLRDNCDRIAVESESEDYLAAQSGRFSEAASHQIRRFLDDSHHRSVGIIKTVNEEKHFGFISAGGIDYFFHHNSLQVRSDWSLVDAQILAGFYPSVHPEKGPRAESVTLLA